MCRILSCCLMIGWATCFASALEPPLANVTIPNDDEPGVQEIKEWVASTGMKVAEDDTVNCGYAIHKWLTARGFESKLANNVVLYTHNGILTNLFPIATEDEIDRVQVAAFYYPKDEYRKSPELEQLATMLMKNQNMLRVFVDNEGDLAITGNITYVNTLSAKEFDGYLNLFAAVVRKYILTEESLKFLK